MILYRKNKREIIKKNSPVIREYFSMRGQFSRKMTFAEMTAIPVSGNPPENCRCLNGNEAIDLCGVCDLVFIRIDYFLGENFHSPAPLVSLFSNVHNRNISLGICPKTTFFASVFLLEMSLHRPGMHDTFIVFPLLSLIASFQ